MPAAPVTRDIARTLAGVRRALPAIAGLRRTGQAVVGKYYGTTVSSTFQPWRSTDGRRIVAVEAYARVHSKHGGDQSPWQLFLDAAVDSDLVTLDRLCRTVHALNYFGAHDPQLPLVLNVDARLLQAVPERHGEFFGKVLSLLGVSPERIVVEIHTTHLLDLTRLKQILASYRRHGFAVAVNAESVMHARSLAHLLAPDLLMLYASPYAPEALARQIGSLAGSGVRVAVKHVETAAMHAVVADAGVDWVQGHYFDTPAELAAFIR